MRRLLECLLPSIALAAIASAASAGPVNYSEMEDLSEFGFLSQGDL